jgi:uncharacterized protein YfaS (alpha-2-macroglobulin family)
MDARQAVEEAAREHVGPRREFEIDRLKVFATEAIVTVTAKDGSYILVLEAVHGRWVVVAEFEASES